MAGTSPTQRTLAYLKGKGMTCAVTERWNAFAKIRQDLFGFIDLVALDLKDGRIIGVQTTSTAHMAERIDKIIRLPEARVWSDYCGGAIWVIGWAKRGAHGERKTWTPKVVTLGCLKGVWWKFDEDGGKELGHAE